MTGEKVVLQDIKIIIMSCMFNLQPVHSVLLILLCRLYCSSINN